MAKHWKISIFITVLIHLALLIFLTHYKEEKNPSIVVSQTPLAKTVSPQKNPEKKSATKSLEDEVLDELKIDPKSNPQDLSPDKILELKENLISKVAKMNDQERYDTLVEKAKVLDKANPMMVKLATQFVAKTFFSADLSKEIKYNPEAKGEFDNKSVVLADAIMKNNICQMTYLDKKGHRVIYSIAEEKMTDNDRHLLSIHEMCKKNENLKYMLQATNKIIQSSNVIQEWMEKQQKLKKEEK